METLLNDGNPLTFEGVCLDISTIVTFGYPSALCKVKIR